MLTKTLVLVTATLLVTSTVRAEVVLALNGEPQGAIVLPADASPTLHHAADDLAAYLAAMSGAKLPVITEGDPVTGIAVHVGPTAAAKAALPAELQDQAEGFLLDALDNRVVICGGSDRGTLFGVYRFLEELGCRWLAIDLDSVPSSPTITVPGLHLVTAPAFDMRTFVARTDDRAEWGPKVGLNGFYTDQNVVVTGNGYYLPDLVPSCHSYALLMPPDKYFATHPEWYPLLGGQRQPAAMHNRQLCVTAPGLADEFARNVIAQFDADPNLQVCSISPNDGYGWCECDACEALDQQLCGRRMTAQGLAGEKRFEGDRVFWFANQVAERVARKYPDKKLLVLAYVNYAEPPDTVKPLPNVIPWLCHYAPADYSRPIADPTSEPNSLFNALLLRWAKLDPDLLFYAYVSKSMWWSLPRPVMHGFAADLKRLHDLGIHRYYCQSSLSDWRVDGPLYYVLAKLMWDPTLDPEAVAQDWIQHMFGGAAEAMTVYYQAVEAAVKVTGGSYSDNPPRDVPGLYRQEDLDRAMAALDTAAKSADSEAARSRVAEVARTYRYGYHMIRCLELAAQFKQEPHAATLQSAHDEGALALKERTVREADSFVSSLEMVADLGVVAQGFGKAEELGGRRCWNADETGLGDGKAGWATFYLELPDPRQPTRLEMDVWGTSALGSVVINTSGDGKGYSAGGVWNPVRAEQPLSGKEQWDTLVFVIPPELYAPGKPVQTIGFGGGDSQAWVAAVRVKAAEP